MKPNTPATIRLTRALHAACVALADVRAERSHSAYPGGSLRAPEWTDRIGKHVALAIAALPREVLAAWLDTETTAGANEILANLSAIVGRKVA